MKESADRTQMGGSSYGCDLRVHIVAFRCPSNGREIPLDVVCIERGNPELATRAPAARGIATGRPHQQVAIRRKRWQNVGPLVVREP